MNAKNYEDADIVLIISEYLLLAYEIIIGDNTSINNNGF